MSSQVFPTMIGAKMFATAASFVGTPEAHWLAGIPSDEQVGFVRMLPEWIAGLEAFAKTPGMTVEAWAETTLKRLQTIVPSDLHLPLRDFVDLGVVARQKIETGWKLKGRKTDDRYQPYRACGGRLAFKLMAREMGSTDEPAVVGFDNVGAGFQTPTFMTEVVEGGHVYLAQHDHLLTGWALYQAAERMLKANKVVPVRSLTVPMTDIEIREDLPWMTGIQAPGIHLDFAHIYAHLKMDEKGSRDVSEMQGGFTLGMSETRLDWVINGPAIYFREVGGQIVSLYHLDVDAYR